MMSSDILSSRSSQELLLYLKVHTQINFQGFFLDKSLFNFQGATHSFRECLNTISHRSPIVNTFFAFFIRFFQPLRVFCGERDFYWVYRNVMEGVFYWGWCFIGLLVYYSFITIPLVLLFLLSQSPAVFSCGSRVRDDVGIVPYRWCDDIVRFQAGERR